MSGLEPLQSYDAFYAIDARTDDFATDDQIRQMFQTLLADRFKLAVHRETRETSGYWLMAARNGPKIKPVTPADKPAPMPEWFQGKPPEMAIGMEGKIVQSMENRQVALTGRRVTMSQLAEALQPSVATFVSDKTGLPGTYYFAFLFARDGDPNPDTPSVFAAVQELLGLRFEKQKGPVEMLVIDHFERVPTGN